LGKHDKLFKRTFKDIDLFKSVLNFYLPTEIKDKLKLETLSLRELSTNFIRSIAVVLGEEVGVDKSIERLKEEIADLVFMCETKQGGEALLINHIEHQSTPDRHFALRNAVYDISVLKDYVDENKPKEYPLVISLLIYHGKRSPYPYPLNILNMFKDKELAKNYFLKPILVDYGQIDDRELLLHGELSSAEIALKHAFDQQIPQDVIDIFIKSIKNCTKIELRHEIFNYTLRTWDTSAKQMLDGYIKALPEDEGFIMTAAQQLIEKGMQKGLQKGMQQGMQQGMQEGQKEAAIKIASNLLKEGLSIEAVSRLTGLPVHDITKLN
jgi:predicted transposase/invertase (TIGR01784 family)